MALESKVVGGLLVVRLHGELDHHLVEQIRDEIERALLEVKHRGLVLSFKGIDFMDSSALGLILGRYRTVTQNGGRMALCEVSSTLRRIFELSGILKIIPVFDTEDAAIDSIEEA